MEQAVSGRAGWLIGWLVGWLVVGWLVGWLVGWFPSNMLVYLRDSCKCCLIDRNCRSNILSYPVTIY